MAVAVEERTRTTSSGTAKAGPRWWQRPWVAPLAVVVVVFLGVMLPPYLTLDPAKARVQVPGLAWYYPVLVGHITFGAIAMVTAALQVWPWLRNTYPQVHRTTGRVYVFAGCIPGGILAFLVGSVSPSGHSNRFSTMMLAVLWVTFTVTGWRMARQHRYADHRRWMLRSFALTFSIVVSRVLGQVYMHTFLPKPETTDIAVLTAWGQELAGMASWPGWILPLLIVEWFVVERPIIQKTRQRNARRARSQDRAREEALTVAR